MGAAVGVIQPPEQASSHKRPESICPKSLGRGLGPAHTFISDSGLQNCERTNVRCFKPHSLWTFFMQSWKLKQCVKALTEIGRIGCGAGEEAGATCKARTPEQDGSWNPGSNGGKGGEWRLRYASIIVKVAFYIPTPCPAPCCNGLIQIFIFNSGLNPGVRYHHHHHFIDEEPKEQRGSLTSPKTTQLEAAGCRLQPRPEDRSQDHIFSHPKLTAMQSN